MKKKLFLLLCALLTMIGVQAQATFTETYTLTGKSASAWTNILKPVPSDGLRDQNFEVSVNGTNGHLLVWGGETGNDGVHYGDNWRDMAFRNVSIGDKVAFTISDATLLDQVQLTSSISGKVSYEDDGATRTFTVNESGVSVLYLARATNNICVTQIKYTYNLPTGFTKVTSASDLNAANFANNYYIFVAETNPSLALRINTESGNVDTQLAYQTQNVVNNLQQLWILEAQEGGFSMRNVDRDDRLIQTEYQDGKGRGPWSIRLNDQTAPCDWTKLAAEALDDGNGGFKIQNTKYSDNYLGLWTPGNDYNDGELIAGNKTSAAQIGNYYIFAIPRSTFNEQFLSETPADATGLIYNPSFIYNKDKGWTVEGTEGNYNHNGAVERYHGNNFKQYQTINNLPNGIYTVSVQIANGDGDNTAYLYGETSVSNSKAVVSQSCKGSTFNAQRDAMAEDPNYGKISVDVVVKDGTLELGIVEPTNGKTWIVFDNFKLTYKYKGDIPNQTVTLGTNGYATFASPYALDLTNLNLPTGLKAYKAQSVNSTYVHFEEFDQTVPANTGILLEGTASKTYNIPVVASGDAVSENLFAVNEGNGYIDLSYKEATTEVYYFAMIKDSDPLTFGKFNPASYKYPSNKAYLTVAKNTGARLAVSFGEEDGFTGINAVESTEAETGALKDGKYLIDGKIVLVKNGVKYDANGKKLN